MSETKPQRLLSLDVFRGLTVAGMMVVNTPGNEHAYRLLDHAEWNGCTLADLVFPFFLFIVGASLVLALERKRGEPLAALAPRIAKRAAIIFALGLFLNAIPHWHPSTLRVLGVLQRIAICYCVCALLFLTTGPRVQGALAAALLIGYWLVMTRVGAGDLSKEFSLASQFDRFVLGPHAYKPGLYDPEGIPGTLPSLATVILGMFAGRWLSGRAEPEKKAAALAGAGIVLAALGWAWGWTFPINKALWSSSYVLWTGGLACFVLADCFWLCDVKGRAGWGNPFEALGVNAIAAYVLPILVLKAMVYPRIGGVQPRLWLCGHLFGWWLSPLNASAAFAFSYAALWTGVFFWLYRRRVLIKI